MTPFYTIKGELYFFTWTFCIVYRLRKHPWGACPNKKGIKPKIYITVITLPIRLKQNIHNNIGYLSIRYIVYIVKLPPFYCCLTIWFLMKQCAPVRWNSSFSEKGKSDFNVYSRSLDPFFIVRYCKIWIKTFWTDRFRCIKTLYKDLITCFTSHALYEKPI